MLDNSLLHVSVPSLTHWYYCSHFPSPHWSRLQTNYTLPTIIVYTRAYYFVIFPPRHHVESFQVLLYPATLIQITFIHCYVGTVAGLMSQVRQTSLCWQRPAEAARSLGPHTTGHLFCVGEIFKSPVHNFLRWSLGLRQRGLNKQMIPPFPWWLAPTDGVTDVCSLSSLTLMSRHNNADAPPPLWSHS